MKRYVQEAANDCKRELRKLEQFALDTAQYYGLLTSEKEKEIRGEYAWKRERVDEIVNQCKYGYITDLTAVGLISAV